MDHQPFRTKALLLLLLARKPLYGRAMVELIRAAMRYPMPARTVYSAIDELEKEGLVLAVTVPPPDGVYRMPQRLLRVTRSGRQVTAAYRRFIKRVEVAF